MQVAGSLVDRALGVLELLATAPAGLRLQAIADRLAMPKSGAHRLLGELVRRGYVAQDAASERYLLTVRLALLGLRHLSASGVIDVAQPVLDRLARISGELVRLAVADRERLFYVGRAQGARSALRYDPDSGGEVVLFCTANGHAWLAARSDEQALALVARQGFGSPGEAHGPQAPRDVPALLDCLACTRARGWSLVAERPGRTIRAVQAETAAPGMAAMAAVVRGPEGGRPIAAVSIAGPSVRLTEAVMLQLAPDLLTAAADLALASPMSDYLKVVAAPAGDSAPPGR